MILFLLKRYLSKQRGRLRFSTLALATLGIFLTTTIVLVTLGVLSGYQKVYRTAVLGFSAHLVMFSDAGISLDNRKKIEEFLHSNPYKSAFSPYHFYETLAPSKKGPKPLIFKGVDFDKINELYPLSIKIKSPEIKEGVLAGKDIIYLQSDVFDSKTLRYLKIGGSKSRLSTSYESIPVMGSFSSGYYDFDSKFAIMPLSLMQKVFSLSNEISGYEIRLHNDQEIENLHLDLEKNFGKTFEILTWKELNKSLFEALKIDRTVVFSVSTLVLLIACLNIFGFNFLFFIYREREFKILSLLGLSSGQLRALLTSMSFVIGGLSVLVASLCSFAVLYYLKSEPGIPLDAEVYFVDKVPVNFQISWFVYFTIGALLLCVLTSFLAGKIILKKQDLTLLESLK